MRSDVNARSLSRDGSISRNIGIWRRDWTSVSSVISRPGDQPLLPSFGSVAGRRFSLIGPGLGITQPSARALDPARRLEQGHPPIVRQDDKETTLARGLD